MTDNERDIHSNRKRKLQKILLRSDLRSLSDLSTGGVRGRGGSDASGEIDENSSDNDDNDDDGDVDLASLSAQDPVSHDKWRVDGSRARKHMKLMMGDTRGTGNTMYYQKEEEEEEEEDQPEVFGYLEMIYVFVAVILRRLH